jgi:hypothetical protein
VCVIGLEQLDDRGVGGEERHVQRRLIDYSPGYSLIDRFRGRPAASLTPASIGKPFGEQRSFCSGGIAVRWRPGNGDDEGQDCFFAGLRRGIPAGSTGGAEEF